ncbi:hypothetical protein M758_10G184300 [Ceratodon purpureus]|nr:hypothetical protein M758_10G184300 [Ceratodon purpureus]
MGASATVDMIELSEGLSLVPCTVVSLSFVRADLSVKPVDEWQLKGGLTALFKKRFGLSVADRDLVLHREKNYFKKRRDEPIADGTLHLWGAVPEGEAANVRPQDGADFGKYFVENVNGVELSVGGLKLKCFAVIKETNDFEALKRSWEVVFGPRREGAAQGQAGPTTLTLKDVPSRWFAEPRVSSKPSVLVTHTIFSSFGEIRNLEVLSNEDLGSNPKDVGSMTAALQCQIWVQFDNHTNFCKALYAFCGRAMHKVGSNFRAMYVVDWDKENYFSVLNVRRRKFEKERLERQLLAEAERIRKEEEARQIDLANAEAERLKMEQMAAALREEEERQQQEQARKLEEESRKQLSESDTSSEEEGLIQDERQESSDDEVPRSEREMNEEDDKFSPPQRVNGRYISEMEGERHVLPVRGKGSRSSEDEGALHPSRTRVKRRYTSEDDEDEEAPSLHVRDKRNYTHEGRRDTVPVKGKAKRRDTSDDEEARQLPYVKKKRRDTSQSESESEDEEVRHVSHASKKRRDSSEDEAERGSRGQRRYTSEDQEERQPPQRKGMRRFSPDDEGERPSSGLAEKRVGITKDGERNVRLPEESTDQEMYNPLERWEPDEEAAYYSKSSVRNIIHEESIPVPWPAKERRMLSRQRSPSPLTTDKEEEESEDDDDKRESGRGIEDDSNIERWALEVTHSAASWSAYELLLQHNGGFARMERPEKRPRSVIMISS